MGNFIFDQQLKPETTRSAAIDVVIDLADNAATSQQLVAWTKLGASCAVFQDTCLAQASEQGLQRLPLTFHLKIMGVDTSNKITRLAKPDITDSILQRLKWSQTVAGLSGVFSGE
jgi:hypothetical protein